MAQVINTNVSALFAGQALNRSHDALQTAQQRLSSGLRINSAADDATGLVTATKYDSDRRGADIAARSASDGISSAQTNDGYESQITANLQRLREIAIQSGSSTASSTEASALLTENTRIAALVTATGSYVVNGTTGATLTGKGATLTLATSGASATLANIDADLTTVSSSRANFGADIASFTSAVAVLQLQSVNLSASYSRVMDTDYAAETAAASKNNILQQAGTAALAQANQNPQSVLSLLR
jgi:flagellin